MTHEERARKGRRMRMVVALFMTLGAWVGACALVSTAGDVATLGRLALERTPSNAGQGEIDWATLRRQNQDTAAWLSVLGTSIDLPVANAPDGDTDFYLDHGFDGTRLPLGCPFLDPATSADGTYALVYGHRAKDGLMFSDLQRAYEQETFDALGECRWSTPERGTVVLEKLCSTCVREDDPLAQTFAWSSREGYRLWLANVVRRSSAKAEGAEAMAARSDRVVGLVTCSSDQPGQPFRTVTLFSLC